jgi:subtilisin family serine protease
MRIRSVSAVVALTAFAVVLLAVSAASAQDASSQATYIVQMLDEPAVAYDGGISGLAATKPAKGQKIDPNSANVKKYVAYLNGKHDEALAKVGGGAKVYDYGISYNGFAAKLTDAQALRLEGLKNVVVVTQDELRTIDTSSTPTFLGLDAPGGLWSQLGGPEGNKINTGAGEGIVVGVIDSGVWPESKSFSDRDASGKLIFQQLPGWNAKCTPGEEFNASMCNQKLIGAQRFNAAWGGDAAVEAQRPWEFMSPRDYNGHGTHTSSTAAGNYRVATTGPATVFGPVNGIAPRARVSAYKALWSTQDGATASGFSADLVAAIDTAVADGVDVINYSISGTTTNFLDAAEVAFLFAADAGVFVSASAGNSGPTTGTVAHPSPWITTVAAGTHNRDGQGSVTLGNGATYNGASVATPVGPAPLIDSSVAGLAGANQTQVDLCYSTSDTGGAPVLDPAKIAGKIVVCDRGVTARVNKSLAVQQAGGVGMILLNVAASSLNADFHFVPTVHLSHLDKPAIDAYAATVGATATINQSTIVFNAPAPFTAAFSSRGPLTAGAGDLLKPDVIAPGQDILAAVAKTPAQANRDFNLLSGTSMSAPHVAGLAALLKDLHPSWTPMMIKSALMTSASDILDGPNTNPLVIFRQGAGHVKPNSAADPGLVYNHGFNDWLAFLCGTTTGVSASTCNALAGLGYSFDPSNLNGASIAIGDLAGNQTVKRKVTNVGSAAATYNASVTGMAGFAVDVSPSSLSLNPGQTGTFDITITRTTATLSAYTGGQLTWSDGTHNVRIPLVIRPVAIAAPLEVSGGAGGISYTVKTGYNGTLNFAARGLVAGTETDATVAQDPDQNFNPADPTGTFSKEIVVPAGLTLFRTVSTRASSPPRARTSTCSSSGAARRSAQRRTATRTRWSRSTTRSPARTRCTCTASRRTGPARTSRCSTGSSDRRRRGT